MSLSAQSACAEDPWNKLYIFSFRKFTLTSQICGHFDEVFEKVQGMIEKQVLQGDSYIVLYNEKIDPY